MEINMTSEIKKQPDWVTKGKSIRQLIQELKTFEDQEMEAQLSFDEGKTCKAISLLVKRDGFCLLLNSEALGSDA